MENRISALRCSLADGLSLDIKEVERLAEMSNEERAEATKDGNY
jgi:hypothetical protein